jgi:N-acetylglucosamine repressor
MNVFSFREYRSYFILNLINHYGAISRTQIANITDFRAATISEIIRELIDNKIVIEKGSVYSGQGRRRTLLELNDDNFCAIGVSITYSEITFIISSIKGHILKRIDKPLTVEHTPTQIIEIILENIKILIEECKSRTILGIGISDPGVLDSEEECSIYSIHFKKWKNVYLKFIIADSIKLPVKITSRNNLIALAEYKFGLGQGIKDFICIELSRGIGMSFVTNGLATKGSTNMSGEIGHTRVHDNDKQCYCGNIGCVEASTSLIAIRKDINNAIEQGAITVLNDFYDGSNELTVSDIRKALDCKDKLCITIVKRAASLIGLAIANTVNILNPECIILTGEMVGLGDYFIETIKESVRDNILPFLNHDIEFKISELMELALPLGAVTMIFSDFLKSEHFSNIYNNAPENDKGHT